MATDKAVFSNADLLLANSNESMKFLRTWLGRDDIEGDILPPAVNTTALDKNPTMHLPSRPFAVYSARSSAYKGSKFVADAIWSLDIPFDLIVFGKMTNTPRENKLHKVWEFGGRTDSEKLACMREAHFVLAPSLFEGYGMVPGEALASGTNCVVFDLPVLREAYGNDLIYVTWNDTVALKAKVLELASKKKEPVSLELRDRIR